MQRIGESGKGRVNWNEVKGEVGGAGKEKEEGTRARGRCERYQKKLS